MSAQAVEQSDRVRRMQERAQRKGDAVALAREQLAQARVPYDTAAGELLDLMASGAPKDQEHAARLLMWHAHPPVAAAQRALREAEGKRRCRGADLAAMYSTAELRVGAADNAPALRAAARRRGRARQRPSLCHTAVWAARLTTVCTPPPQPQNRTCR
jgi:hypothetical protein